MSAAISVSNSLMHICLNSSSCHNVLIILSLSGATNLSLLIGVCAACILAYRYLQMKWWATVTVVAIPSQKALLMCPYVSSVKFSVLAPRCSRALLHNLQLTSDRCLILASHLATGMIPAIAIISRLLCLQGTRKKVAVPAAILFRSISMAAARISASGDPTNVAFPPSPIHLVTAFNNDRLSHKYSNGSLISVSWSASKNAANSGRFELEPSSSRPTLPCILPCCFWIRYKKETFRNVKLKACCILLLVVTCSCV